MTRLSAQSPRWGQIYRDFDQTPNRGGFPTDTYTLEFICPDCGPPYTISIRVGPTMVDSPRRWIADPPVPDGPAWTDHLTITPSINNHGVGHGPRHPTCGFHKTLIDGEFR